MGWDVVVLDRPSTARRSRPAPMRDRHRCPMCWDHGGRGSALAQDGAASVAVMPSAEYRKAHPEDAVWAIRPGSTVCRQASAASRIAVFAEDEEVGALAAADLAAIASGPVALVQGGIDAWRAAGRQFVASPDEPPTPTHRLHLLDHDRHAAIRTRCAPICAGKPNCPAKSPATASPASAAAELIPERPTA